MTHVKTITEQILKILIACTIDGLGIRINSGQLDRKTYTKVNDILTLMGGNWNRAKQMHMFPESPADLLETVCATGEITDRKKQFQAFNTPDEEAARAVQLAEIEPGDNILEPSAGTGRIAKHLSRQPDCRLWLVELDLAKANSLMQQFPRATVLFGNFLDTHFPKTCAPSEGFDAIVMNPPFSGKQDIAHIRYAMTLLAPGGRLVAICANGPGREQMLKFGVSPIDKIVPYVTDHWEELPAGTFRESGTDVRTILMRIRRVA